MHDHNEKNKRETMPDRGYPQGIRAEEALMGIIESDNKSPHHWRKGKTKEINRKSCGTGPKQRCISLR
jgi:hypothetical protein